MDTKQLKAIVDAVTDRQAERLEKGEVVTIKGYELKPGFLKAFYDDYQDILGNYIRPKGARSWGIPQG